MSSVAIIGAGQLGSRHLQSLALIERPLSVFVVDPEPRSLETARLRLGEAAAGRTLPHSVAYSTDLGALPDSLDLAVVATLSDVRERVVADLLSMRRVRGLILEKVLFQDLASYERVAALLRRTGATAWVNCPRRLWPHVQDLRRRLAGSRWLEVSVGGTQWGLASNAVHFLDFMAFLAGRADFRVSTELLDAAALPSKRSGFVEFSGTLSAALPGKGLLTMSVFPGERLHYEIRISSEDFRMVVHELEDRAWVSEKASGWGWKETPFPRPLMSQSAHLAVEGFLESGTCALTPFEESAALHAPLIEALTAHLRRTRPAAEVCPIT